MAEEAPSGPQPLVGFMSNAQWDALVAEVAELMQQVDALPDSPAKDSFFRLLNGFDALHREALRRLVRLFREGVLEAVISDPAIHELMELYDLLPPPAGAQPRSRPVIPIRQVRAAPPVRFPHWVPVLAHRDELAGDGLRDDIDADGSPLVLARHGDEWFALDAACPVDGSSLRGATLAGYTLTCPQHAGCHYDVRNGARLGGGSAIPCHPVKVEDEGRVLVGFDMDFQPHLPSF